MPRMATIQCFSFFLVILAHLNCMVTGGFYADNGVDQTLFYPKISKRERKEMQQEILSLLGLDHRPKPHSHETDTSASAPKFMLDLYNNIIDGDTGELRMKHGRLNFLSNEEDNQVDDADIIMSFVNHGKKKKKRIKKCRRLHPKRFPQVKLHSAINWPSCKTRNSTNRTNTPADADGGKVHLRHEKERRFWFDVSEVPVGETLLAAELRIYKESIHENDEHFHDNYTISIFEIIQGTKSRDRELNLVDTINVTSEYEGWLHLNVSGLISKWLIFPETNRGLYMRILANAREVHPREVRLMSSHGRHDQQPFMVAFFKAPQDIHIRHARSAKQRQRTDMTFHDTDVSWKPPNHPIDIGQIQKRSCQKWTLYVSFKELGWQDWIIAPDGYAAFYCAGECAFPLNTHMNATNHAIVQTLVHLMNPFQVPKPCCAPTKLTAISVLYFDDNSNVILKKYRNMVVKSCGCH